MQALAAPAITPQGSESQGENGHRSIASWHRPMPLGRGLQHSLAGWGHPDRMRAATAPAAHGGDNRRMEHCTGAFRGGSRSAWWHNATTTYLLHRVAEGRCSQRFRLKARLLGGKVQGFGPVGRPSCFPAAPGVSPTRVGLAKRPENAPKNAI